MPLRTLALTATLILAAVLPPAVAAQEPPLGGFRDYVETAVEDWEATGLAVAVVKDGELLFADGFGVLVLGGDETVDEHTRFAIGSTTKAMTAAAVGMLVDEGKLDWDDAVIEHLPWFRVDDPWVTREITVRDLLTHRAGLGNADFLWYERDADAEEIVRKMALVEPAYSMRSSFIYQNIMYATAGQLVEAVSGAPWPEFVRSRIFRPLGMSGTVPVLEETVGEPNVAHPHHRVDDAIVPIENASVDAVAAAGSVWSSVSDMSRWLRMLLNEGVAEDGTRILSEATVEEMFRPQTMVPGVGFYPTQRVTRPSWTTYGLAWFQHDYRGHKVDFHTGSIDGMVAIAGLIRDLELGVYVLANRDHVEVRHALMYRAFDHFLGGPDRDWSAELKELYDGLATQAQERSDRAEERRVEGTSPSLETGAYAGRYSHPLFGELLVRGAEGGLRADLGPGRPGSLHHWSFDTFRLSFDARWRGTALVTFTLGADGVVTGARIGGFELRRTDEGSGARSLSPAGEHHAHLRSDAATQVLLDLQKAVGQEVVEEGASEVTAEHLLAAMDSAGVGRAQVLSVAYFFGFPDLEIEGEEEGVRTENDFTAAQVARYPDRLAGACSVNPLADYAVAEVQRCADDPRLSGLKLHFANSDVDLLDPEDVARVAAVFRTAGNADLPIVVHMRTRNPDYGARDVRVFVEDVLSQAPGLPVQVAHMAGWGGYDEPTDEALSTFIEAFRDGTLDRERFFFDLAAVVLPPERAEADSALVARLTEANATLAARIRELGTDRVLFATDWDAFPIEGYVEVVRQRLGLDEGELADVMDNLGPLLR